MSRKKVIPTRRYISLQIPKNSEQRLITLGSFDNDDKDQEPDIDIFFYSWDGSGIKSNHIVFDIEKSAVALLPNVKTPSYHNKKLMRKGSVYKYRHGDIIKIGDAELALEVLEPSLMCGKLGRTALIEAIKPGKIVSSLEELLAVKSVETSPGNYTELPQWIIGHAMRLMSPRTTLADTIETVLMFLEAERNKTEAQDTFSRMIISI